MDHFENEEQAARCGKEWLKRLEEVLSSPTSSDEFKARRANLLADRAYRCFSLRLKELNKFASELDPNY